MLQRASRKRGSYAHGKAESLDAQPHCQLLRRMRRVMHDQPAGESLRALGTIISQNEAGIKCRSGQHGQLKKTTEYTVQIMPTTLSLSFLL